MLDIRITGFAGNNRAVVRIANNHTNIVYEEINGRVLKERELSDSAEDSLQDKSVLNIGDIVEFADTAELGEISPVLENQITYNSAIAEEGLSGNWGANIGSVLMKDSCGDIRTEARAYAAAGSDARRLVQSLKPNITKSPLHQRIKIHSQHEIARPVSHVCGALARRQED